MPQENKLNRGRFRGPGQTAYFRGKALYYSSRYEENYDTLKQSSDVPFYLSLHQENHIILWHVLTINY